MARVFYETARMWWSKVPRINALPPGVEAEFMLGSTPDNFRAVEFGLRKRESGWRLEIYDQSFAALRPQTYDGFLDVFAELGAWFDYCCEQRRTATVEEVRGILRRCLTDTTEETRPADVPETQPGRDTRLDWKQHAIAAGWRPPEVK